MGYNMDDNYKYYAFISYSRQDEEWAKWLQHELEHYHLPDSLKDREDLPKEFRPVFRDVDELKAGELPGQIYEALKSSANLIVICSPRAVKSKWVNKEINDFIEIGHEKGVNNYERIFPFIIEGVPDAQQEAQECFPKALRDLPEEKNLLGSNVNENGRDRAFVKVVAGMLPGVGFDDLRNRYEYEKRKKRNRIITAVVMGILFAVGVMCRMYTQRQQTINTNWERMKNQSRFVAEEAQDLINAGDTYTARRLLLEVLPKDVNHPSERPYTNEAEKAFRAACLSNCAIFNEKNSGYTCAVFSPDNDYLACASQDTLIMIRDAYSGKELQLFEGHTQDVYCISYSPDGKYIVSSAGDFTIKMWDVSSGKVIWSIKNNIIVNGLIDESDARVAECVTFSPNGKYIASASQDGIIRIMNSINGKIDWTIPKKPIEERSHAHSVAFSPDGKCLAFSVGDCVEIWDFSTREVLQTMDGNAGFVYSVAFSPNGKQIVSASREKVILWDVTTGDTIRTYNGHGRGADVLSAAFSPDGKYIVSSSVDRLVKVWDVETGMVLKSLKGHEGYVWSAKFSPDGKRIVSASWDNTVRIWDLCPINEVRLFDGKRIDYDDDVLSAFVSSDNRYLFSFYKSGLFVKWDFIIGDSVLLVNKNKDYCLVNKNKGYFNYYKYATFSPDGKLLYTLKDDNYIRDLTVWDTETGIEQYTLHDCNIDWFLADDDFVFTFDDKTIKLWDPVTGMKMKSLKEHEERIRLMSLGQEYFISLSVDDTLIVWDKKTKKRVNSFRIFGSNTINSISISPLGQYVVVSFSDDELLEIWDAMTGELIGTLKGISAGFSMDEKHVVSISREQNVFIWNVEAGALIHSLDVSKYDISPFSASFTVDGKNIILLGKRIGVIDFPPLQELIDQTYERFKDCKFNHEERRLYYLEFDQFNNYPWIIM